MTTINMRHISGVGLVIGLCSLNFLLFNNILNNIYEDEKTGIFEKADYDEECVVVQNKVLPNNITHSFDRLIPRVIHLFVPKRCLPPSVVESVIQPWLDVPNHSVLLHDFDEISHKLSTHQYDFVRRACTIEQENFIDLARFVYLYDDGGLSFDLSYIPGPGFHNGTIFDVGSSIRSEGDDKPMHVVLETETNGRFVAAEPKNFLIMSRLLLTVGGLYHQFVFPEQPHSRGETYSYTNRYFYEDFGAKVIKTFSPDQYWRTFSTKFHLLDSTLLPQGEFLQLISPMPKQLQFPLDKSCGQFIHEKQARNPPSMEALMNLTDHNQIMHCPNGTSPATNAALANRSYNYSEKLIPPIIHMTAKSKCLSPKYLANIDQWKNTGHSFFLHDDAAVQRLFDEEEWSEFPLLREILPCMNSGAMKADLWRYLLTWKYGGIYTDMDNAPGKKSLFTGEMSIKPEDDAFFEIERGGFPSQYFYAVTPHHPVSYFMLSQAIHRLLLLLKVLPRKVLAPVLTGPGACKTGVILTIGGTGYYNASVYRSAGNRSITMVGSRFQARKGVFVRRAAVTGDLEVMNMSHYQNMKDKKNHELANHHCLREVFEKLPTHKE